MSFINNAHPGSQIHLLCLIYRIICENPAKFTAEELQGYCAPKKLFKSSDAEKRFRAELKFWSSPPHNLWAVDDKGKLILDTPELPTGYSYADVAHQLRHRLMEIEFTNILGSDDEFGASKAMRSFAYILTQDKFVLFGDDLTTENIDRSISANFGSYSLNNSEKSYFIQYCNFLGLSEKNGSREYLDPTRLIRSFLKKAFQESTELKLSAFIRCLSQLIPIIDNGKYNIEVRKKIGAEVDTPNILSAGLSHALNRLHEERIIQLSTLSDDSDAVILTLPDGLTTQYSSVLFEGVNELC
jgi:hypothetical protein